MIRNTHRVAPVALIAAALAACAAPPLRLYTLTAPAARIDPSPLPPNAVVIVVDRVSLPDYLDTQDILIRRGQVFDRSQSGRWVSRLSVSATDLLRARLASRRPGALVTESVPAGMPDYEISVHVEELDVASTGAAVMRADWQIIPRDTTKRIVRDRIQIALHGSVASDERIVTLEGQLFDRLAAGIDLSPVR